MSKPIWVKFDKVIAGVLDKFLIDITTKLAKLPTKNTM